MASVNERLADAAVSHAIDLTRFSNGAVRRMIALLNRADADLFAQLMAALERVLQSSFQIERIDSLLASVRDVNARAYEALRSGLEVELRDLVAYEADYQLQLFQSVIPAPVQTKLAVASVSVDQVYAAAMARPMQGRLMREWAASIETDKMLRIRDALRIGFVEGETIDQMVRRIRGTRARGYSDGLIELDRRHAEAVVRTATSHVAGFTRDRFHEANADLISSVQWVSTLDGRTSSGCRARDGLKYTTTDHKPVGHKMPWSGGPGRLHWNCRSSSSPVIKSWRELGIDEDELPPSTRASMDGQVPEDMTYAQWLKKQSAKRQDDVLGPTRGKLMREGELSMDRFHDDKGKWLTLDEIRKRDAGAFARMEAMTARETGVGPGGSGAFVSDLGFDAPNIAARDAVFTKGSETGHEWMSAVDNRTGKVFDAWTDKKKDAVSISDALFNEIQQNGGSSLTVHHNHPSSSSLSSSDLQLAARWKFEIAAHGHNGSSFAVKVNDSVNFQSAYLQAEKAVEAAAKRISKSERFMQQFAYEDKGHLVHMALHKAGIIDYRFAIGGRSKPFYDRDAVKFDEFAGVVAKKIKL